MVTQDVKNSMVTTLDVIGKIKCMTMMTTLGCWQHRTTSNSRMSLASPPMMWQCQTTVKKFQVYNNDEDSGMSSASSHHLRQHYDAKLQHPESSDDVVGISAPPPTTWRCQTMASRVIRISGSFNLKISIVWQWWWLPGWCWHCHTTSNGSPELLDDGIIAPPLTTWRCQTNGIRSHRYLRIILFKNFNCSAPCPKMTLHLTEVD